MRLWSNSLGLGLPTTTEPEAQKRDDINVDTNGEDVQMDENEDSLLDDFDIFGDLQ